MTFPLQALRTKLTAAAFGAVVLAAGHAAAKNHDCQSFRMPSFPVASHDRAPGPAVRLPN